MHQAQRDFLQLEANVGGYRALEIERERVEHSYEALARLLNCHPHEIAITENATTSWNMAFHGFNFKPGDRILTAESEYASNYISYLRLREKIGIEIIPIASTEAGEMDTVALRNAIDDRVKLIAVTHVPTNGGVVNPARAIGEIAKEAGIPYMLDACQSVGQIDLDVETIGCDILTGSGRKFLRGPRGTGFLYVRRSILDKIDPPFLDMHGGEWIGPDRYTMRPNTRRFENWEFNYAAVVGLGVAVDYALKIGMKPIEKRTRRLANQLRQNLQSIPGITMRDLGKNPCGIVTFSHEKKQAADIK
ncbi:MAG: aminotransferase class V-fold PLP-dependent enzyme, partial [Gammaproteobacteria bacterium]|nr:aminotransferase class V-fold PLP-dependent enzyme [Gammaproteobacteria bacterium]